VKCEDCRKYVLKDDGTPYIDKCTEKPLERRDAPDCSIFGCKKNSILNEAGLLKKDEQTFEEFLPTADRIFRDYQTARAFGVLPASGGICKQDENLMWLFNILSIIENGSEEKQKFELAKFQATMSAIKMIR